MRSSVRGWTIAYTVQIVDSRGPYWCAEVVQILEFMMGTLLNYRK